MTRITPPRKGLLLLSTLLLGGLSTSLFAQGSATPQRLGFWNGPEWLDLSVDGRFLGVRFDAQLSEIEIRNLIAQMPAVAAGVSTRVTLVPGHTAYLRTDNGVSAQSALQAAAQIRRMAGVLSASPRLWALEDPYYLTEEILVRWLPDTDPARIEALTADLIPTDTLAYSENPGQVYRVPHGADPLAIANRIAESGAVEFATPDFQLYRVPYATTNDPLYGNQWHLESTGQLGAKVDADIDVEGAWAITRGLAGVKVAVVDTGVELNHPDLRNNLLQGIDVLDNDNNPKAEDFLFGLVTENHSTSVCGVSAGQGNNGIGTTGVSQNSGIIPIRFLSEWIFSQPTTQDEADAFNFANSAGAAVVNNSWGPSAAATLPASTKAAIDDITTNGRGGLGSVVFFAAGNSGANMSNNGYASYNRVIAVSACTDQEVLAGYSSFGAPVDVCAPSNGGVNGITTTDRLGGTGYSGGDYTDDFGGTSSASPCAAGVMLLVLSANPSLTRTDATAILLTTAEKIDVAGGAYKQNGHSNKYGFGRVNAEAAVIAAGNPTVDTINLTGDTTGSVGSSVNFDYTQASPNSPAWLLYALQLNGSVINGQPFDIGPAVFTAATGTSSAAGTGSWTVGPLPNKAAGRTVYLEVRVDSAGKTFDSNSLTLVVS